MIAFEYQGSRPGRLLYALGPLLTRPFSPEGRSSVKEAWLFLLLLFPLNIGLAVLVCSMWMAPPGVPFTDLTFLFHPTGVQRVIVFGFVWAPMITLAARRLHDIGLSGLWVLLALWPWIGPAILMAICLLIPGNGRTSRHGAPPRLGEIRWGRPRSNWKEIRDHEAAQRAARKRAKRRRKPTTAARARQDRKAP